jgi:type I restriction enzyme S subunit
MKLTLNEICTGIFDCEHKTAPLTDSGFPSIRTPNIGKGRLILEGVNLVSEETYQKWTKRAIPEYQDLIFAREAPAGNVAIIPQNIKLCLGQRTVLIKPDKGKVSPEFLCYYLLSPLMQQELLSKSAGSTVAHINVKDIKELNLFNLPPLLTQRRIASILSAYDDLIENNLRRIKLLEEIAQRTYEEWFVKFRINGEQLPIDEKTELPLGWKRRKLKEVINIVSGYPFKSTDYVDGGRYKIVTIKNVQDGYFVPITTDSLFEIPPKVKNEQILHTGDIILSLTGNVGRVCLTYGGNYLLNQRVAKLVPSEKISTGFIYSMMRNEKMLYILENISNGTAQQNLSPINMGNVEIVYPDENTVYNFNKLSDASVRHICNLSVQNQYLKESRDILLPKLMSGTIKVSES